MLRCVVLAVREGSGRLVAAVARVGDQDDAAEARREERLVTPRRRLEADRPARNTSVRPSRAAASQNSSRIQAMRAQIARDLQIGIADLLERHDQAYGRRRCCSRAARARARCCPRAAGCGVGPRRARGLAVEKDDPGRVAQAGCTWITRASSSSSAGADAPSLAPTNAEGVEAARVVGRGEHEELRRVAGDHRHQVHQLLRRAVGSGRSRDAPSPRRAGRASRARPRR